MKLNSFPPVYLVPDLAGNGLNSLSKIQMSPNANPNWRAVYAQERYEYNRRWLWWPVMLFVLIFFKRWWTERLEEMGHSVECAYRARCGEDIDAAEDFEIASMLRDDNVYRYKGLWPTMTPEQLKARMVALRPRADRWVRRYWDHIDKIATRAGK